MIIEQQRAARVQMQGGANEEYSTYDEDVADTEARHRRVDVSSSTPSMCVQLWTGCPTLMRASFLCRNSMPSTQSAMPNLRRRGDSKPKGI